MKRPHPAVLVGAIVLILVSVVNVAVRSVSTTLLVALVALAFAFIALHYGRRRGP